MSDAWGGGGGESEHENESKAWIGYQFPAEGKRGL